MTLSSLNQTFRKDTRTLVGEIGMAARQVSQQLQNQGSQVSTRLIAAWEQRNSRRTARGAARLNFTRDYPQAVDLLDLLTSTGVDDQVKLLLGRDEENAPVVYDLTSGNSSIVLISGNSAAGKSGLMRTMAVSLAATSRQSQVQMGFIGLPSEPIGIFRRPDLFSALSQLPHSLFEVARTAEEAVEVLEFIKNEVAYRQEMQLSAPLLVLFIDNVDRLLQSGDIGISRLLRTITEAAPSTGLRIILSAADPWVDGLRPILREHPMIHFAGRTEMNPELGQQPASSYLYGQGDFLARSNGDSTRFQAAFMDDYDLIQTLNHLHSRRNGTLLARKLKVNPSDSERVDHNSEVFDSAKNPHLEHKQSLNMGSS